MNTASASRTILSVRSESRVVQVMSDVWEQFSFFVTTELVDGKVVIKDEVVNGQPKPVVNATEADIAKARVAIRKQAEEVALSALAWVSVSNQTGCFVEVVRGRKVPVGSKGLILKSGANNFGKWFLVRFRDGSKSFVSAGNCEVEFPLTQEQQEDIVKWSSKSAIEQVVDSLDPKGFQKVSDDVKMAVNRTATSVREGRLFFA
jgi:hypothetical protein